eukprot:g44048.t1
MSSRITGVGGTGEQSYETPYTLEDASPESEGDTESTSSAALTADSDSCSSLLVMATASAVSPVRTHGGGIGTQIRRGEFGPSMRPGSIGEVRLKRTHDSGVKFGLVWYLEALVVSTLASSSEDSVAR